MKDMSSTPKHMVGYSSEDYHREQLENKENGDTPTTETVPQGGYLWRMGSGMYSLTKGAVGGTVGLGVGAVGLGVGAVKLVATSGYSAVSKTAEVGAGVTKTVASKSYNVVSGSVNAVTSKLPSVQLPRMSKGKDKEE